MRLRKLSIAVILCWACLLPAPASWPLPPQLGKLQITSTPQGAGITLDGQTMNQKTNATFVVQAGKHVVSVNGGPGALSCLNQTVWVSADATTPVDCLKK